MKTKRIVIIVLIAMALVPTKVRAQYDVYFSHYFDMPEEAWMKAMEAIVPAKFLEMNKKAFELGKNA